MRTKTKMNKLSALPIIGLPIIGRILIATIVIAISLAPSMVFGQAVAVGQATATVQAVLSVTATSSLAFGAVFQGIPKAIANNNASAGIFTIGGEAGAGISIFAELPDYLATATGDDRMTISFTTTDASVDTTANVNPAAFGSGWQNTNPHNFPSATVVGTPATQSAVFLGGNVIPSVDQAAGAYTADIVLTVAYNGN